MTNGEVIEELKRKDTTEQLWRKGVPDNDGYFTLENAKVPKFMTAIDYGSLGSFHKLRLQIKGNKPHNSYMDSSLFVDH